MVDLFAQKSQQWDKREMIRRLSDAIGLAIRENLPLSPQMRVLDFGAGTGLVCSHIAPCVKQITAVDISAAMLEQLAAKQELQHKVEIICQDILDTPLQRRFDVIISAMALHHIEDTEHLFQRFADLLEPQGWIALADLDTEDGSFHPPDTQGVYHHGFDRAYLENLLLQQGFESVQFHTPHIVKKAEKSYPVFLLIARKS